jgi:UDP-N-acetylglucosamine 2-epimerase (non-hydrolysing)
MQNELRKRISVLFGTRPEAIKLAPVILSLKQDSRFDCRVCVTGQHRQMLDQVLAAFEITPDVDLNLMLPNQTLGAFTSRAIQSLDQYIAQDRPDLILVQGDTTTVFCAALAAFYHHVPVGHVEAGLRTWNLQSPWPEEANRVLTSRLATLHFAPTSGSRDNLLKEGVSPDRVFVTGNTVIDALLIAVAKVRLHPPSVPGLPDGAPQAWGDQPLVLITGHRRESFGAGFENICQAIAQLARQFPRVHFVYPVHLNPNVREPVSRILGSLETENVHLIDPLSYFPFVSLMDRASIILTDSGGIQEEAPSLGKPVLVMRDTTERPEAVQAGTARIVGTDRDVIVIEVSKLLLDRQAHDRMTATYNPYGDGRATERILAACKEFLTE